MATGGNGMKTAPSLQGQAAGKGPPLRGRPVSEEMRGSSGRAGSAGGAEEIRSGKARALATLVHSLCGCVRGCVGAAAREASAGSAGASFAEQAPSHEPRGT